MPADAHCYAVRLVNPLQGVMQVVAIEGARALSQDGRWWEIQVLAERPDHTWGSVNAGGRLRQFFRFGSWHPAHGVRRVPANPVLDIGAMQAASERLIGALEANLHRPPFPQGDRYECWLLDQRQQPLALLATASDAALLDDIQPPAWQATPLGECDFVAASLCARGIPNHDGHNPRRHAHELEGQVRKAATGQHWYLRDDTGHYQACDQAAPLPPDSAFPALALRTHWATDRQSALAVDYLDWCAPWLLTWDTLTAADRQRLEHAACRRPLTLDTVHPLYPTVIDQRLLDTARVEARLRRSQPQPAGNP